MPVRRTMTLGRTSVQMVRLSEIVADDASGRAWCKRECAALLRDGIVAEVFSQPGMLALYRERRTRRLPINSCHDEAHHVPPETMRIHAEVRTWPKTEQGETRGIVWAKASPWVLSRRYRCAFCRRDFVLDEHEQEFIEPSGGGDRWRCHGVNMHSRCCRECLPKLSAFLEGDAERPDGVQEEQGWTLE